MIIVNALIFNEVFFNGSTLLFQVSYHFRIFQYPPLSPPIRLIFSFSFKFLISRAIELLNTLIILANSAVVIFLFFRIKLITNLFLFSVSFSQTCNFSLYKTNSKLLGVLLYNWYYLLSYSSVTPSL